MAALVAETQHGQWEQQRALPVAVKTQIYARTPALVAWDAAAAP